MLRPVLIALARACRVAGADRRRSRQLGRVRAGARGGGADRPAPVSRAVPWSRGDAERMQELFPEGSYFLRALTALAEAGAPAGDVDLARELRDSLDRPESVAVFGSGMVPEHGIFQAGWALAVSVEVARASRDGADAADVRRRAGVVDAALRRSRTGFLEGYPGQYWPCDSVVAASALAEAAVLLGRADWLAHRPALAGPGDGRGRSGAPVCCRTGWTPAAGRWRVRAARRSRSSRRSGRRSAGPWTARGSAELVAVPGAFVVREAGLVGVREYPRGTDGPGDVDSGPLAARGERQRQRGDPGGGARRRVIVSWPRTSAGRRSCSGLPGGLARAAPVRPRPPAGGRRVPGLGPDAAVGATAARRLSESARVRSLVAGLDRAGACCPGSVLLVASLASGRRRSRMPH